jgi:NAD-dependent DNA ligase
VLILGDNPGSKYEKAKELNIEIWSEEDLLNNIY